MDLRDEMERRRGGMGGKGDGERKVGMRGMDELGMVGTSCSG